MTDEKFQKEVEIIKFWEEKGIYEKVKSKNKGNKPFNWVEGPPYPTGEAHLGHLRNWAIKDSVMRFRRLEGFDVYSKDGYDVHGLPVEQKVQQRLGINDTKELKDNFGIPKFIDECRKYVDEIINDMKGVRKRYGFWLDTEQYQTSHPEYISMAWRFFKKAQEKDLLYKDFKCVAWSPALETTLSDYEVKDSYAELEDPSIYVRFKILEKHTTTNYAEYLLIWTTTPWTLEANLAIAINRHFNYAKVLVEDEAESYVLIVGEPLVEQVISNLSKTQKIKSHKVLEIISGSDLIGIRYEHAYPENETQKRLAQNENYHRVVHADFVSLGEGETHLEKLEKKSYKHSGLKSEDEISTKQKKVVKDGTGLAHEAPAHGMEDFELCRDEGINEAYCVVDERGLMISESMWAGKNFRDSNKEIIDYLLSKKIILHNEWRKHTYPLCWRSKVPIVYRTTEQWYIKRSDYTKEIVKANANVKWFPEFAQTSFNNLMSDAGDWAISRQRFWGTPIPIFEDEDGNYEVFGSKEELEEKVKEKLEDLHLDNLAKLSYEKNGKVMKHVGYTADVWFDSGCASFASHYNEGLNFDQIMDKYYPMSWITESEDQIRGWFSSLFNVGYMVTNKAPYNEVLYYKFVMAKDGQKMSKSLGNGLSGNEAIETWGSDITRYYLLTKRPPEDQINFDQDEIPTVQGFFNTLENVFKLLTPYLEENPVSHPSLQFSGLDIEDKWILYKLNRVVRTYKRSMFEYKLNYAFKEVEEFLVRDFSKTYLKLVKDRLEERDENLLIICNEVLKKCLVMLAPACPFTTEDLYVKTSFITKKESIFLESMPTVDELIIKDTEKHKLDENFELVQEVIQSILNSREKAKIGVRWPLGKVDILSSVDIKSRIEMFEPLIKKLTNVHKIAYDLGDIKVDFEVKPNFENLKKDFDNPSEAIKVINLNKFHIVEELKTDSANEGIYEGVKINYSRHLLKTMKLEGDLVSSEFSLGTLILETSQDEILLEEGYLRELFRRVQDMRKNLGLNKKDEVELSFDGSDKYYLDLISNCENMIKKKVGAKDILTGSLENSSTEEFEIKDKKLVVSLR